MPRPRAAQSSNAQSFVVSKGAPDSLNSFLDGFVATGGAETQAEQANVNAIEVQLKLLNKSSEVTKQKALAELTNLLSTSAEDTVTRFTSVLCETVIRHAHFNNPLVRANVFTMLKALVGRGKEVKMTMTSSLRALSGPWVMAMNDMESAVRREACAAFETAFAPDKRQAMLSMYKDEVVSTLTDAIDAAVAQSASKPLQDDALDPRANAVYSALRAMGYMAKQVSASQAAALSFVCDSATFRAVMPLRTHEKGYLAAKTPLVRAAALALLRDLASVCPFTIKLHQVVSLAVQGSIRDSNVEVTSRCWELLLVWCRTGPVEVINHAQPGFLDDVIDCFMECEPSADRAAIIFPCLLPLLTPLSKDARCSGVLDEFAGALVEKTRLVGETPNATAKELETVLVALMESWELQCVRKRGTDSQSDCGELFTVSMFNLSTIMEAPAKRRRFLPTCARAVGASLLRTATRSELIFTECASILCARPDAAFRVLPDQPSDALVQSFHILQASVLGHLMGLATAPGAAPSRSIPLIRGFVDEHVRAQLTRDDLHCLTVLVEASSGRYVPPTDLANRTVQQLTAELTAAPKVATSSSTAEPLSPVSSSSAPSSPTADGAVAAALDPGAEALRHMLVSYALTWECADRTQLLSASSTSDQTCIRATARQHLLGDRKKAYALLLESCAAADFDSVRICLLYRAETTVDKPNGTTYYALDAREQLALVEAVVSSLETAFRSVCTDEADDSDMDEEAEHEPGRRAAKRASNSKTGDHSGDDVDSDDDDAGSQGPDSNRSAALSEADENDEPAGEDGSNNAVEVLYTVAGWCDLLARGSPLSEIMGLTKAQLTARIMMPLWRCVAAVAPCLHPEHYAAVKALRVALQDAEDDVVASALDTKTHFLNTKNFDLIVDNVRHLFASYDVSQGELDAQAEAVLGDFLDGELPESFQATQQLQHVVPFASIGALRRFATSPSTWDAFIMEKQGPEEPSRQQTALSLFDGYYPLSQIDVSMFTVVRTGQLVRLLDTVGVDGCDAGLFVRLLEAASMREALSSSMCRILFTKLLPAAFACFNKADEAAALAKHMVTCAAASSVVVAVSPLLCTLAAVIRDIAHELPEDKKAREPARVAFLLNARRVVSAVTLTAVDALFSPTGAAGIDKATSTVYTAFYALMDQTAGVVKDNILAQLPSEKEALVMEASQSLPSWDTTTAKLTLVVHRHLGRMPEVAPSTVKSLIDYAQRQNPMECLELLAELSCTRILDMAAFSDLVRGLVNALSRCHTLLHLPTNGRLTQANPNRPMPPASLETLRRTVTAASLARQGVVIHSRMDDVLRSTVNLVVFDALCEAVLRLRTAAQGTDTELLAKLIASTTQYMGSLLTNDVQVLRASEASTAKIAAVLAYAYAWLYGTAIAKLEAIGMDVVEGVIRSVCLLSNLTLMRVPAASAALHASMRQIISKISLKPLRDDFSSADPLKLTQLRRQNNLIDHTHKQKLLLFPYTLAWCIHLTAPPCENDEAVLGTAAGNREVRQQVYHLLDLLGALLFAPKFKQARRVEDTFVGDAVAAARGGDDGALNSAETGCQVGITGFEVVALTRADAPQPMLQLARGAAAALQLLISSPVLSAVKSWLETLERKVRALIMAFVEQFLSPPLINQNLMGVLLHGNGGADATFTLGENLTVTVNELARTVNLAYEMEDAKAEVQIVIPSAFPLRQPVVRFTSGRDSGVSVDKWRGMMLRMTAVLFGSSADIWGCIELFQQNLDAHFSGQEPCPICFAVVNAINHKLPEMRCSVCHNSAFHSNCLYTWWANGGHTMCPLCRSPWVSE